MSPRAQRYMWALILGLLALFLYEAAFAAKLKVTWVPPTTNTDGTPLKDLASYHIEWGSCKADGSFDSFQSELDVAAPASWSWIYPVGLNPVCVRIYALNAGGAKSPAAFASGPVRLPTLGTPTQP